MSELDTLLAHLSPWFTSQTENIAVEALNYVLTKYTGSREGLDDVVRSGVKNVRPIVTVRAQVTALDGTRPDLVGYDETNQERVLVEAKFWAELTPRQPHDYLERLPSDGPAALLFIAPEERIPSLWPKLRTAAEENGKDLTDVDGERKCVRVGDSQKHLLLVSWTGLLDRMSARTRDVADAEADIRQLRGLADFAEEGKFQSVHDPREDLGPDSRYMRDLKRLIDSATERGINNGWASKKGLNRTPRSHGYGRYLKLGDRVVWIGVNTDLWEEQGKTPLWIDSEGWVPLPILAHSDDVGFEEVLNHLVSELKKFAENPEDFESQ